MNEKGCSIVSSYLLVYKEEITLSNFSYSGIDQKVI